MQQQQDGGGALDTRVRDPNRFYCPYPGCNRSFAELWRLKVHYRAPPDVRGSGKERGHGTELKFCPKCNKELKAGKHHVGCSAGRPSGRTSSKKKGPVRRQQLCELTLCVPTTPAVAAQKQSAAAVEHAEAPTPHFINGGHYPPHDPMYFDHDDMMMASHPPLTIVVPPQHGHSAMPAPHFPSGAYYPGAPQPTAPFAPHHHDDMHDPLTDLHGEASTPWASSATADPHGALLRHGSGMAEPSGHVPMHRSGSQAHPSLQGTSTGLPMDDLPNWPGFGGNFVVPEVGEHGKASEEDHTSDLLGVGLSPSPPPLPPDWDTSVKPSGLLFDFDSFNVSKQHTNTDSRPFVTVTSAMNPTDMVYPSDDYIMQVCVGRGLLLFRVV